MISRFFVGFLLLISLTHSQVYSQTIVHLFADTEKNDTIQHLADNFIAQLKKAIPADFVVHPVSAFKGGGIVFTTSSKASSYINPSSTLKRSGVEAFSIQATSSSVVILGNCNMAIGHGIFTYLDKLGYRFYFANPDWHITPSNPKLFFNWSIVSKPAFDHRRIWYGYGTGSPIADKDYNFWVLANRLGGSMNAYFGHAYEEIAFRNLDTFAKHPDWIYPPLKSGALPYDIKFDMSKEDLVQFLIRDAERRIETSLKNKTSLYKMISMGPSDGPGTCNTPECQKLGSITDRVFYLVNRVAKAVRKKYPSTLVGCLAYGEYSPPPTRKVEPNVFVGVTTAFNASKFSVDKLVDEWKKKGAIVGIYDYFSWFAWDFDVPGQSLASRTTDLIKSIKKYYSKGVKAYEAESSIGWISKGLGYYLASKYMWDIKTNGDVLKKEFFRLCFGKAETLIQQLWTAFENYPYASIRDNDWAKWLDLVSQAEKTETSPAVQKRFFQIKSYLHYLFLYHQYQDDKSENNLLQLLNFGYRKLDDGSVSGYPAFWELGNRSGYKDMGFVENAKWKYNHTPVTDNELNSLLLADKRQLKLLNPVNTTTHVTKLTTIPQLKKYERLFADSASGDNAFWMTNEWVFEIKKQGAENYFDFTGDFIGDKTNIKSYKISIYSYTADGNVSGKTPIKSFEYNKTKEKERFLLSYLPKGFYTMIIEDPTKIYRIKYSPSVNYSLVMRPRLPVYTPAIFYSFIYVPEGTRYFNVSRDGGLELISPTQRVIKYETVKNEVVQIPVGKDEAGLWRIKLATGKLFIEGIPPFIGTSAYQMLIPVAKN